MSLFNLRVSRKMNLIKKETKGKANDNEQGMQFVHQTFQAVFMLKERCI